MEVVEEVAVRVVAPVAVRVAAAVRVVVRVVAPVEVRVEVRVAAPAQGVEQGLEQAVAMALVRVQEQALARAPPPQSVLAPVHPSAPDLGLPLARARLGVLGLVPALLRPSAQGPTHPSVQALAARSGMEPAMAPLMELGTKA